MFTARYDGERLQNGALRKRTLRHEREARVFGNAEHIADTVIADFIAGAKFRMRIVVKRAPARFADQIAAAERLVQHPQMAHGVLHKPVLRVKPLGREHMAVALGDQERHRLCKTGDLLARAEDLLAAAVGKVVEGVHILLKFAACGAADAAGLARRVKAVRRFICAAVKGAAVRRFVDADAPENDGRMVVVAQDHFLDVLHGNILPRLVADVLPAGNFFKDQQAKLVTAVKEVCALRIMARPHEVNAELLQQLRVAALHPRGHGIANVGETLMAIQSMELPPFSVQIKAVRPELAEAHPEACADGVSFQIFLIQLRRDGIERRILRRPVPERLSVREFSLRRIGPSREAERCNSILAVSRQLHPQLGRRAQRFAEADGDLRRFAGIIPAGADLNAADVGRLRYDQTGLAVNAAVGQIIDHVPAGRDVRSFGRVHADAQRILRADAQMVCQLHGKRRVAALVRAGRRVVAENLRIRHHTLKAHKYAPRAPCLRRVQRSGIDGNKLVRRFVEVIVRKKRVCVRQLDGLGLRGRRGGLPDKEPVAVERKYFSHGKSSFLAAIGRNLV